MGENLGHTGSPVTPKQWADQFLGERNPVRWTAPEGLPRSLTPAGLFAQATRSGLEVVLVTAANRPSAAEMRTAHKVRRARPRESGAVDGAVPKPGRSESFDLWSGGGRAAGVH